MHISSTVGSTVLKLIAPSCYMPDKSFHARSNQLERKIMYDLQDIVQLLVWMCPMSRMLFRLRIIWY